MKSKYVLDTHAIVWYLEGNPRLGAAAKSVLDATADDLVIPIIALAEAAFIVNQGKTNIPSTEQLLHALNTDPRVQIAPLSYAIFELSQSLDGIPEIHDALIVATALWFRDQGYKVSLLTKDREIVKSNKIEIVWR